MLLLYISSCTTKQHTNETNINTEVESISRIEALQALISKTSVLPDSTYTLTPENPIPIIYDGLYKIKSNSSDTLFFYPMNAIYGLLPDTSKFYSFLSYEAVENGALAITNIDKSGVVISTNQLSNETYGFDCGYLWFGEVYVQKEKSFLIKDSIVTFECGPDEVPEEMWTRVIVTRTAKILPNGKLSFSELKRDTL